MAKCLTWDVPAVLKLSADKQPGLLSSLWVLLCRSVNASDLQMESWRAVLKEMLSTPVKLMGMSWKWISFTHGKNSAWLFHCPTPRALCSACLCRAEVFRQNQLLAEAVTLKSLEKLLFFSLCMGRKEKQPTINKRKKKTSWFLVYLKELKWKTW